jgi:hypothetical protein
MPRAQSPYLRPNRPADVIAAIQALSSNEDYDNPCERWSWILSGTDGKADHWRAIFSEHPEFFRSTTSAGEESYSLIWRRSLPRIEKATGKVLHARTYHQITAALNEEEKRQLYGRPPLQDSQVKALIDIAINLHKNAVEARRDLRWWIGPIASLVGTTLSATLAFMAAWWFGRR